MKNFFKSGDFECIRNSSPGENIYDLAAIIANYKLQSLVESWSVVYGEKMQSTGAFIWTRPENTFPAEHPHVIGATHKARLAFIEELSKEPCKHVPDMRVGPYSPNVKNGLLTEINCIHCGVKLQATWGAK